MILTPEQQAKFEAVSRPLIEFLNYNCHPHVTVVVSSTHAELSEGVCAFTTTDYVRDYAVTERGTFQCFGHL